MYGHEPRGHGGALASHRQVLGQPTPYAIDKAARLPDRHTPTPRKRQAHGLMARRDRPLSPEEQTLWQHLTRSVRALRRDAPPAPHRPASPPPASVAPQPPPPRVKGRVPPLRPAPAPPPPRREPVAILDSGWEKRIRSGALQPERSVDLHGHTLGGAHATLDAALSAGVRDGVRVLLVVTGKPRPGRIAPGRGAIRAEIGHWLERSPHADRIASVRVAHPRHGGDGALYVILRRGR